ncbi:MAG: phosphatidylserine decarboxylase [Akkermansia sp.]|nr:phosphatidylserine decarboxylase [Akkermansia sp.]
MKGRPILIYNRYTKAVEQEHAPAEGALRFLYGCPAGALPLHLLVKRAFFSRLLGWSKNRLSSVSGIEPFIRKYGIEMKDFEIPKEGWRSFNEFFYRRTVPGARPVCGGGAPAFPADGRHSGWQDVSEMKGVFLKGQRFDLPALLGDEALARRYAHGSLVLSRLSPVDYHRFHFVSAGIPSAPRRIPGPLASVSPLALRRRLAWLWTNKRELTLLETPDFGTVLTVAVGATGVGAIHQTYKSGRPVEKGDEQGYFAFGGSTIITLFEEGRVRLAGDLSEHTSECMELYAHQGDALGAAN